MIALPEIETIRRDLDRDLVGRRIKTVEVGIARLVKRFGPKAKFEAALDGLKITSVERRGLRLLLGLDDHRVLVIDLGSKGLVRRTANKDEVEKRTALTIGFTQGGQLRLIDRGTDASVDLVPADELEEAVPELAMFGVDAIEQPMSWPQFGQLLRSNDTTLMGFLNDPTILVGIGDVYTDEILFNAGLRHDRRTGSLTSQEIRRLYRALVETLHDAVKYRGTTLDDRPFVDVTGEPGSYQDHLNVYQRAGELSPRSRRPIAKAKVKGRWTYFCEQSQV